MSQVGKTMTPSTVCLGHVNEAPTTKNELNTLFAFFDPLEPFFGDLHPAEDKD